MDHTPAVFRPRYSSLHSMKKSLTRAIVVALMMASAAAVAVVLKPDLHMSDMSSLAKLEDIVPETFGNWRVEKNLGGGVVNPQTEEFLKTIYDETLSRTYINTDGKRIMLSLAFGADQTKATQVHRPEVCYPAQGFQIKSSQKVLLPVENGLPAMRLVAVAGQRIEPITYWIVVGDSVVRGSVEQKIAIIKHGMNGVIPHGLLFRVSTIGSDFDNQFLIQQNFVTDLHEALGDDVKKRLYGALGETEGAEVSAVKNNSYK